MPAGRPTKCTPEARQIICEAVAQGLPYNHAAALAHIRPTTFYLWQERGNDGEEPYATFVKELEEAQARFVQTQLANIQAAAYGEKPDWRASAFLLERRDRKNFGVEQKVEHSGSVGLTPLPVFGATDAMNAVASGGGVADGEAGGPGSSETGEEAGEARSEDPAS